MCVARALDRIHTNAMAAQYTNWYTTLFYISLQSALKRGTRSRRCIYTHRVHRQDSVLHGNPILVILLHFCIYPSCSGGVVANTRVPVILDHLRDLFRPCMVFIRIIINRNFVLINRNSNNIRLDSIFAGKSNHSERRYRLQ